MRTSKLKIILLWWIVLTVWIPAKSQNHIPINVTGRVCEAQNEPVGFATIVLTATTDSTRIHGGVSEADGTFSIQASPGEYMLSISFLGYDNFEKKISLISDANLGDLILSRSNITLKEVVVTGNMITREADRFVVNLANTPLAIGRDGKEILQLAPGVWVSDGGDVQVYGRSGTRVMVNDRLLRETGSELASYLQSLKAEDIQKIEVIPYAGSDFDANMKGGVIKITLKKQRQDGWDGAVTMRYNRSIVNDKSWSMQPSFNLKYRYNKFSLYTNLALNRQVSNPEVREITQFTTGTKASQQSVSERPSNQTYQALQIGALYDIDDRQNFGIEVNMARTPNEGIMTSNMQIDQTGNITDIHSVFSSRNLTNQFSITGNYKLKLDTLGSLFKLLLDYNHRYRGGVTGYNSIYSGYEIFDTTYRNSLPAENNIIAVNGDFEIVLSKASKIRTGLKYTNNLMNSSSSYEYFRDEQWRPIDVLNYTNRYTENIGALYVIFSTKFKNNISLSAGLRGEYTYAVPSTSSTIITDKQSYFGFFPNASLAIPLNKKSSQMIALSYSRKINRPSFNALNPYRIPISEYSFNEGNPRLKPAYENEYSFSWIMAQKYTLTGGFVSVQNDIGLIARTDPNNPDVLVYRPENIAQLSGYYVNLSIPTQLFKWWSMNLGLSLMRVVMELPENTLSNNSFFGNMSNTFTLWKKWYLDLNGFYMSSALVGNVRVQGVYRVNVAIKHTFAKNHLTASLNLNDIFNSQDQMMITTEPTFHKENFTKYGYRNLGFSLRYNFKAGKNIKVRNVESGAKEETERLKEKTE